MWKNYEVDENKNYTVAVCQAVDGRRYFELVEENQTYDNPDLVAMTDQVPYDLLFNRDFEGIVKISKFSNGMKFGVEAHGIWLTNEEIDAFLNDVPFEQTPWLNGICPNLPPC